MESSDFRLMESSDFRLVESTQENMDKFNKAFENTFEGGFGELERYLAKMFSFEHDYATIAQAFIYGLEACVKAMGNHKMGGITGFQHGFIMNQFFARSLHLGCFRIMSFEKMLFPQYEHEFNKTIDRDTWEWVQERAKQLLEEKDHYVIAPRVLSHWKSVANGEVPFGYKVLESKQES